MPFEKGQSGSEHYKFKKGQSGNLKGRPVKSFTQLADDFKKRGIERATPERVIEAFEYLLALPVSELKEMVAAGSETALPSLVEMAAEEMTGKKKREILNDMLDRAHGKSTQRQQMEGKLKVDSDDWFSRLPLENRIAILKMADDAQ